MRGSHTLPDHQSPKDDQDETGDNKAEVPDEGSAQVVTDVVDAQEVVVDGSLDEVEHAPPQEDEAGLFQPRQCRNPLVPVSVGEDCSERYDEPRADMKEPVSDDVEGEALVRVG